VLSACSIKAIAAALSALGAGPRLQAPSDAARTAMVKDLIMGGVVAWTVPRIPIQKCHFQPEAAASRIKSRYTQPKLTRGDLTPRYRMRTFGFCLGSAALAATLAATLATPSLARAQRNSRRSAHHTTTPEAASAVAQPCSTGCGDYSLSVVSALLPAEAPGSAGSDVVTLVIENRGTVSAPVSLVSVGPKSHLVSARHSAIPALAPGERVTVQLPVEEGPDGTQCISITISPAPEQDPARLQVLASTAPIPATEAISGISRSLSDWSVSPDLPYWPDIPAVSELGPSDYVAVSDFLPFSVYGAI
jgi:hypothetical protein